MLPDGYSDVPAGKLAAVVTCLEMREPPDRRADSLGSFPYLGPGYQLLEREPGTTPWAGDVHVFNAAASLSFGRPVGDIPSLATGVPRLVRQIVTDLFQADQARPRPTSSPAGAATPESHLDAYAHVVWHAPDRTEATAG